MANRAPIAGATPYNHTMLVGIDDSTQLRLDVIDGYPQVGAISPPGTGDAAIALLLTPVVSLNGHYSNANRNSSTPYVSTRSSPAMCATWASTVGYANAFPLAQSPVRPPPGPQRTPGWNFPIVWGHDPNAAD